jgi:ATP-dependent DNA ligase
MMRKKPMLAYPVSDKPIDYNKPVFMQPKLDGVRCIIQAEKLPFDMGYDVVAYSRTGKQWKNIDHILQVLVPFLNTFQQYQYLQNHTLKSIIKLT